MLQNSPDLAYSNSDIFHSYLYSATPEKSTEDQEIVKAQRKPKVKLIVAPFPETIGTGEPFFFEPPLKIPLTTGFEP